MLRPSSAAEAAEMLRECGTAGRTVRIRGGATKLDWSGGPACDELLDTSGLAAVVEHNAGDFTAVVQAGARLADLQSHLASAGQTVALDPPGAGATVGGVLATADSGPHRHRYGGARDAVLGVTVALSDGTLARSGGKVIKNVAGYDLGRLFTGSHGTLGLIVEVALRLHPGPAGTATAVWETRDARELAAAAATLARAPVEADCLDVFWEDGRGALLVRFSGATAAERAAGVPLDARVETDDEGVWAAQRAAQRSADGAVLKVAGRPGDLGRILGAAEAVGGRAVARAALGPAWIGLEGDELVARAGAVRSALAPRACTLLDAPAAVRSACGTWPAVDGGALAVMARIKARFDPARVCAPGCFVGGL